MIDVLCVVVPFVIVTMMSGILCLWGRVSRVQGYLIMGLPPLVFGVVLTIWPIGEVSPLLFACGAGFLYARALTISWAERQKARSGG